MTDETGRRTGSQNPRESKFAATRASGQDAAEIYEFGPFRLEPVERTLSRNNEAVVLTPKVFDTLVLLVRNSGHLLGRTNFSGRFGQTPLSRREISPTSSSSCAKRWERIPNTSRPCPNGGTGSSVLFVNCQVRQCDPRGNRNWNSPTRPCKGPHWVLLHRKCHPPGGRQPPLPLCGR